MTTDELHARLDKIDSEIANLTRLVERVREQLERIERSRADVHVVGEDEDVT